MKKIFSNFCREHKTTIKNFAKQYNLKLPTLYSYNQGIRIPNVKTIGRLEKITNGEINYYSFIDKDAPVTSQSPSQLQIIHNPSAPAPSTPLTPPQSAEPSPTNPQLKEASNE